MSNILVKIINNESPSYKIYEDDDFVAVLDVFPQTNGHFLVIPKKKSATLFDMDDKTLTKLIKLSRKLALHAMNTLDVDGFTLKVNYSTAVGRVIQQTHVHILLATPKVKQTFEQLQKVLFTKLLD